MRHTQGRNFHFSKIISLCRNSRNLMDVIVNVSRAELADMECTEESLHTGLVRALGSGIEDDDGTVYLAGFSIIVNVTD